MEQTFNKAQLQQINDTPQLQALPEQTDDLSRNSLHTDSMSRRDQQIVSNNLVNPGVDYYEGYPSSGAFGEAEGNQQEVYNYEQFGYGNNYYN